MAKPNSGVPKRTSLYTWINTTKYIDGDVKAIQGILLMNGMGIFFAMDTLGFADPW